VHRAREGGGSVRERRGGVGNQKAFQASKRKVTYGVVVQGGNFEACRTSAFRLEGEERKKKRIRAEQEGRGEGEKLAPNSARCRALRKRKEGKDV